VSTSEEDLAKLFQSLSDDFDTLCRERHEAGAVEYGTLTFVGNDVIRMMMEEMADTANYARYQYIKLMLLQNFLVEKLTELGVTEITLPTVDVNFKGDFKGVADMGWSK
jgi:hypothetical protein